jgi:hypothetical protein
MMKTFHVRPELGRVLGLLLLSVVGAWAQIPGAGGPGMGAALGRLFGDIKEFKAKMVVQVLDTTRNERASMPMDFAFVDKKIRVEMDATQIKNREMHPGLPAMLRQMGMAQVVSIIRPDKKTVYVIYPDQKAVLNVPLPNDGSKDGKEPKVEKTPLGKETIDGHPCVKNKVLIKSENDKPLEAITWNATDLKDFPVQVEITDEGNISVIHFKEVQFVKTDAKQFDAPAGFTEYKTEEQLKEAVMRKMQGTPPPQK